MLTHLPDGLLRRYLDEPAAVSDDDRVHLSGCPQCRQELDRAAQTRDLVARALALPVPAADAEATGTHSVPEGPVPAGLDRAELDRAELDRAWQALRDRLRDDRSGSPAPLPVVMSGTGPAAGRMSRAVRRAVRRPVTVAVTAGLVVVGGTAAAAAADWLPIFHTEKVTAVQISRADLDGFTGLTDQLGRFSELSAYGSVVAPRQVVPDQVPDAAAAAARTGLVIPQVARLPQGVEGNPSYQVVDRQTMDFTFSAAAAARSARAQGVTLPPMPAGLDGTRLRIDGGPGVAEVWGQPSGVPTLVVVRAKAPTAGSQGAPLEVIRGYLLSMPGISSQLAEQLRTVSGDGTTLPIPVPTELATSSPADVGGVRATVLQSRNGMGAAVIWVKGGELNVVLGPLSQDEVLAVARGLR